MSNERHDAAMSIIDQMHDADLSEALTNWFASQDVSNSKMIASCLRLASIGVAQQLNRDTVAPDVECEIIETYADYFHMFVHVGIDIMQKREKNKARGRK